MAKGWTTVETIYSLKNSPETRAEKWRKARLFEKMMAGPKLSVEEIRKRSVELYNKNKAEEDSLLQAFADKRLKSEKAIKQAIRIKKERAKRQNGAKQDTEKVSVSNETTDNPV